MKLEAPNNLDTLCADLGIGLKRRARMAEEQGENLIPFLQKLWTWARAQDTDNYLHINPGFGKGDYTDNPGKAARTEDGSPEWAPPSDEIGKYRASREARDHYQSEQMKDVGDLMAAMTELRAAIDSISSERKRQMGRSFWILRTRLDAAERDLRRRIAA